MKMLQILNTYHTESSNANQIQMHQIHLQISNNQQYQLKTPETSPHYTNLVMSI